MIELEKQQDPTKEEVQEWVNQIYEYAADLYINQNKSWREVKNELVKQGLNDEDASTIV